MFWVDAMFLMFPKFPLFSEISDDSRVSQNKAEREAALSLSLSARLQ